MPTYAASRFTNLLFQQTRHVAPQYQRTSSRTKSLELHRTSSLIIPQPERYDIMEVQCQCGAVSFTTPTPEPIALYHCHCTQCRKQSASAFGTSAIFSAEGIFPLSPDLEAKLGTW